jgi:hypothetical protein
MARCRPRHEDVLAKTDAVVFSDCDIRVHDTALGTDDYF